MIAACYSHAKLMEVDCVIPKWKYSNLIFPENEGICTDVETYREPKFEFSELPKLKKLNMQGFFQSPRYFENYKDEILKEYTKLRDEHINVGCAIHVRRTDYVKEYKDWFHNLADETSYYEDAMSKFKFDTYHVYSDDIEWCKSRFKGNFIFVDPGNFSGDPLENMLEFSNYEHIITSNSTYAWWAAYMSGHSNIIAPKLWFRDSQKKTTIDLIPKDWILI